MTLTYQLHKNDYLQLHLFNASKSASLKKRFKKAWIVWTLCFLGLSAAFYLVGNKGDIANFLTLYFLVMAFYMLFFWPAKQKKTLKKSYEATIDDVYKNRYGHDIQLRLSADGIETSDFSGEAKLRVQNIEAITEVQTHFFIKLRTGETLIIPKSGFADITSIREELKRIASRLNINYATDLSWSE